MSTEHFVTKCSCGAILNQCRCADPNKTVTVVPNGCDACEEAHRWLRVPERETQ